MNGEGRISVRKDWPAWVLLVFMFGLAFYLWPTSPERMAVHWNVQGEVDRYGSKFEGLFLVPLITLGIYLAMIVAPLLDPGRANYRLFKKSYTTVRLAIITLMAAVYVVAQMAQASPEKNIIGLVPVLIGVLFIIFGNLMGKIRPNWFVGIRTPWTLTSKQSWNKTHRFGGIGMMIIGLIMLPLGYLKFSWTLWLLIGMIFGWLILLLVYSYLAWRKDPDRISPAGSLPADDEE